MRLDRGRLGWGLFLVVFGLIPLTVTTGLVDPETVRQAWQLWPLLLIGLGIGLLAGRAREALVSTIVVSLTLGVVAGSLLAGAAAGSLTGVGCTGGGSGQGATTGTLASGSTVTIESGCGDLDVTAQAGSAWQASGAAASDLDVQAGPRSLTIRPVSATVFRGLALTVALPTDPQFDLHLKSALGDLTVALPGTHLSGVHSAVSLGRGELDLGGATLTGALEATFSLGSGTLTLPLGAYTGTVTSSFGSLDLCVPAGEAVHLTAHSSFGSTDVGDGFTRVADGWQTDDFATAAQRADVHLSSSFGSISITRGACG
ncbi:MAG: hypothetical protein ACHQZR_04705 [Candidatus Limnocylindrales bacterium]